MPDLSIKCTLFRASMVLSYCATKCPHAGRGSLRCPDLVRLSNEKPDEMRSVIAAVHAGGAQLHGAFKAAFPAMLPEGVTAPMPVVKPVVPATTISPSASTPTDTTLPSSPTSKASKAPEPSVASKATTALEPKSVANPAAPSSKPAPASRKEKEKTMNDPANTSPVDPATAVPAKRKGGLPKGYKFATPRGSKKNATATAATSTGKSRNTGMIFFVETEPKSGLFKIEALKEFGDVMMILDGSNRRVIGAVSAREF